MDNLSKILEQVADPEIKYLVCGENHGDFNFNKVALTNIETIRAATNRRIKIFFEVPYLGRPYRNNKKDFQILRRHCLDHEDIFSLVQRGIEVYGLETVRSHPFISGKNSPEQLRQLVRSFQEYTSLQDVLDLMERNAPYLGYHADIAIRAFLASGLRLKYSNPEFARIMMYSVSENEIGIACVGRAHIPRVCLKEDPAHTVDPGLLRRLGNSCVAIDLKSYEGHSLLSQIEMRDPTQCEAIEPISRTDLPAIETDNHHDSGGCCVIF